MDLLDARKEKLKTEIVVMERTGAISITSQVWKFCSRVSVFEAKTKLFSLLFHFCSLTYHQEAVKS